MWYVALWYTYYLVSTFCVQTSVAVESRGVFYVFRNTYFVHAYDNKNTPEITLGALREMNYCCPVF